MPLTQITNPFTTNSADSASPPVGMGRQNDQLVSELHGKYYTANYRGALFNYSTPAAGVTLPASSTTNGVSFAIWNPPQSGRNMVLTRLLIAPLNAALVVGAIGFAWTSSLTVNPTALTEVKPTLALLGSNANAASQMKLYSAATLAAALTNNVMWLTGYTATAGLLTFRDDLDGQLIIGPGTWAHLCCTTVQTQASAVGLWWYEPPL